MKKKQITFVLRYYCYKNTYLHTLTRTHLSHKQANQFQANNIFYIIKILNYCRKTNSLNVFRFIFNSFRDVRVLS